MVRVPSSRVPPISFAHRGARAQAPENTLEAFALGLRLGASGLESDAWITADGAVVLDHDGVVGRRPRRRPIAAMPADELPEHIPTLEALYATCGTDFELSLDIKDPAAAPGVIAAARAVGAAERLWLCHHDWEVVAGWRATAPEIHLVDSTFLGHLPRGPERRAAELQGAGIDAINLHRSEWSGGLTTLFHRFDLLAFAWDCQHDRHLDEALDDGVDAVYSDHVDRMVDAVGRAYPPRP